MIVLFYHVKNFGLALVLWCSFVHRLLEWVNQVRERKIERACFVFSLMQRFRFLVAIDFFRDEYQNYVHKIIVNPLSLWAKFKNIQKIVWILDATLMFSFQCQYQHDWKLYWIASWIESNKSIYNVHCKISALSWISQRWIVCDGIQNKVMPNEKIQNVLNAIERSSQLTFSIQFMQYISFWFYSCSLLFTLFHPNPHFKQMHKFRKKFYKPTFTHIHILNEILLWYFLNRNDDT